MGVLFLELNGRRFSASEETAAQAVWELAAGRLDETGSVLSCGLIQKIMTKSDDGENPVGDARSDSWLLRLER